MNKFLKLISNKFSKNNKTLSKYYKTLNKINNLENEFSKLSYIDLKKIIDEYRLNEEKTIEKSFALIREASKRVLGLRHYDVQIIGGLALVHNNIAEMKTGEGKTLVSTLAAIHNAYLNKKVHVITVNDYLAERDKNFLEPLYEFLGVTTSLNISVQKDNIENITKYKRDIYSANVIYGTNLEFAFDYLKNNSVKSKEDKFFDDESKEYQFVIIDEVDSVLIDDCKKPLILSEPIETDIDNLGWANDLVINHLIRSEYDKGLIKNKFDEIYEIEKGLDYKADGHFYFDNATKTINIFEEGFPVIEDYLIKNKIIKNNKEIYYANNHVMHHINNAINANYGYIKDKDYIVNENSEVVIIDKSTGRLLLRSRWNNGLHQAIEYKESVNVKDESKIISQTTYQNFFNIYAEKSGMTGTADTEAAELLNVYNLNTVIIPTNKEIKRVDYKDKMYPNSLSKYKAIVEDIKERHNNEQPILIGTPSLLISEKISDILKKENINHVVLNAKNNLSESKIIRNAGTRKAITICTNMGGRGTDIILGGNIDEDINDIKADIDLSDVEKNNKIAIRKKAWMEDRKIIEEIGGLCVIGIDRNDARRIDNQLKGRAGRQGEIGTSVFYISLDDDLIVNNSQPEFLAYARKFFNKYSQYEEQEIETSFGSWSKIIEQSQFKVEKRNERNRKDVLKYDEVINEKRVFIYKNRDDILYSSNEEISNISQEFFEYYFEEFYNKEIESKEINIEDIDSSFIKNILKEINNNTTEEKMINKFDKMIDSYSFSNESNINECIKEAGQLLYKIYLGRWENIEIIESKDNKYQFERLSILGVIDELWSNFLSNVDVMKNNVKLSTYIKKDPLVEFKTVSHQMFLEVLDKIKLFSVEEMINSNMEFDDKLVKDISEFKFSDDIENLTPDEVLEELKILTKELLLNDLVEEKNKS